MYPSDAAMLNFILFTIFIGFSVLLFTVVTVLRTFSIKYLRCVALQYRYRFVVSGIWSIVLICWISVIAGSIISNDSSVIVKELNNKRGASLYATSTSLPPLYSEWYEAGLTWKENISWFAPVLSTTAGFIASVYAQILARKRYLRKVVIFFLLLAFITALGTSLYIAYLIKMLFVQ